MSLAASLLYLDSQRDSLAANLATKGVTASSEETLAELVPKVLDISQDSTLTGDAAAVDVLDGKTFYSNDPGSKLTGSMPDNGTVSTDILAKATEVTIAAGKHSGSGKIKISTAEQDKIISDNIKSGITILGVAGSSTVQDNADATAAAADIAHGKTAYVNGAKITGSRGLDDYTKALLHFDGDNDSTTFTDETGKTWTAYGDAKLKTAVKAYGTASGYFDGVGDYISTPDSDDFNYGADPFTIEAIINLSDTGYRFLYRQYADANNYIQIYFYAGRVYFQAKSGGTSIANYYTTNVVTAISTWYHVAVARSGSTIYMFINGVSVAVTAATAIGTTALPNLAAALTIGNGGDPFYGYMDELRISKGICRWSATFFPGCPYGG